MKNGMISIFKNNKEKPKLLFIFCLYDSQICPYLAPFTFYFVLTYATQSYPLRPAPLP